MSSALLLDVAKASQPATTSQAAAVDAAIVQLVRVK
jgi:hypothetical protein